MPADNGDSCPHENNWIRESSQGCLRRILCTSNGVTELDFPYVILILVLNKVEPAVCTEFRAVRPQIVE